MSKKFNTLLYFATFIITTISYSQPTSSTVKIVDINTLQAVGAVYVKVVDARNNKKAYTTLSNGVLKLPSELFYPVKVSLSHINYAPESFTLESNTIKEVFLAPKIKELDDVVVTGQVGAKGLDESILSVSRIDSKTIDGQGANTLFETLGYGLNLTLDPNKSNGTTSVSMLGLGGEYVKVLIDGIPFVSADGNGNNADLSQINLNNVERVEIIEGGMSVNYGANAVAGVINVITNSPKKGKTYVDATVQEESVAGEYGLDKGRHIQTVGLSHSFNKLFGIRLDYRRNDFDGYLGEYQGVDYKERDEKRGYEWQPKVQNNGTVKFTFSPSFAKFSYRLDYQHKKLVIPSKTVGYQRFKDKETDKTNFQLASFDDYFFSNRINNNLTAIGAIAKKVQFNIVASYSKFQRNEDTRLINLEVKDIEPKVSNEKNSNYSVAMSRGTFSDFINSEILDWQVGYEVDHQAIINPQIASGAEKQLSNFSGFTNAEVKISKLLSIRAGIRLANNTVFKVPLQYESGLKFSPFEGLSTRFSYSNAYRTPSITELYYYFVDANHNVRGNENLTPENAETFSLGTKYKYSFDQTKFISELKVFHNDIKDKISLATIDTITYASKFININRYKSKGITFKQIINHKNISASVGATYSGILNDRRGTNSERPAEFLFSSQINSSVMYNFLDNKFNVNVFYKYTGAVERFVWNKGKYIKGKTDDFHSMGLNLGWKPIKGLQMTFGVKNLLNITNVNTTAGQSGAHSAAPTSFGRSYGRSYFLRIKYLLNLKK